MLVDNVNGNRGGFGFLHAIVLLTVGFIGLLLAEAFGFMGFLATCILMGLCSGT